jgi:uncharacterized protein (DUF362 family)
MVITDIHLIESMVKLVQGKGSKITVVESDNISGTADKRVKESGLMAKIEEWGIKFTNLSKDYHEEHSVGGNMLRLSKTVMDADYFINMPKIKTCGHTLVTLGIKNLFGILQRARKNKLHKHLDDILPYLAKTVSTDLTIVDGITCMEGNGPLIGHPKSMGLIIAGKNLVSVDAVCSNLMGYNPHDIAHIAEAAKNGLGEIDVTKINILGDDWKKHIGKFDKPYTFSATLKSIKAIKDIYLG